MQDLNQAFFLPPFPPSFLFGIFLMLLCDQPHGGQILRPGHLEKTELDTDAGSSNRQKRGPEAGETPGEE